MKEKVLVRKSKSSAFYEAIDKDELDKLILHGQVDYEYVTDHYEKDKREGVRAVKRREYFHK